MVFAKIGDIQKPKAVLGWIKQIAFCKSIDHYRKNKREIGYEDTSMEFEAEAEDSDILMLPEDILVNLEVQKLIRNMVNNLLEDQKKIIIAYYYGQSKVDDIVQIMGIWLHSVTQFSYNLGKGTKDTSVYIKGKVIKNIVIISNMFLEITITMHFSIQNCFG